MWNVNIPTSNHIESPFSHRAVGLSVHTVILNSQK
jgi:hypothetical protein